MKTINALAVRNNLGKILQELEETQEPVLVSKGRKIRAVLISVEDFQRRFVDKQADEQRKNLLKKIQELKAPRCGALDSLEILRDIRGYGP